MSYRHTSAVLSSELSSHTPSLNDLVAELVSSLVSFLLPPNPSLSLIVHLAGFTNILGAVLQLCASPATGLGIFYAGRVIGGMGVGSVSMVVPIYIAEISPTGIRGRLVGFYELLLQCGGLISFWIPYAVNQHIVPTSSVQWRIPVGLQLVPAGVLCLGALLLTESPRWLLKRGQDERAIKNLTHLRNLSADHSYIVDEIASIRNAIALETGLANSRGRFSVFREIALPGNRNRLGTACLVMVFQNLTGINAINYYSPTVRFVAWFLLWSLAYIPFCRSSNPSVYKAHPPVSSPLVSTESSRLSLPSSSASSSSIASPEEEYSSSAPSVDAWPCTISAPILPSQNQPVSFPSRSTF